MSKENREHVAADTSVLILLREHERLSALYLNNVELGEKRTTSYLTLVSISTGLLIGVAQRGVTEDFLLRATFGLVIAALIFGLLTFQRLLERRVRAIEYLRAINRIHGFFVLRDPLIREYFYWSAYDDIPPFFARGTTMAALRDLVAAFNSLFAGVIGGGLILIIRPHTYPIAIGAGLIILALVLLFHLRHEKQILGKTEEEAAKSAIFPKAKNKDHANV